MFKRISTSLNIIIQLLITEFTKTENNFYKNTKENIPEKFAYILIYSLYHFFDDSWYICTDMHFNHLERFGLYHSTCRFYVKQNIPSIRYFKCTYKKQYIKIVDLYTSIKHLE